MGKMGKFSASDLAKFQKQLEEVRRSGKADAFMEGCAKELAARLLAKVIKRTPVGDYGGTVEFDVDIPAGHVEFDTKDGKHVSFDTKARKKHVKFTPKTGKKGGTLRRGWTGQKRSSAQEYANSLAVHHSGHTYVIEIVNPVEYAPYVEYGHRTANHKGWVSGKFMLTISEQEIQTIAPKVLESRIKKYLEGCMK